MVKREIEKSPLGKHHITDCWGQDTLMDAKISGFHTWSHSYVEFKEKIDEHMEEEKGKKERGKASHKWLLKTKNKLRFDGGMWVGEWVLKGAVNVRSTGCCM